MTNVRSLLMFAPSFPPISWPGTHRPLRFAKYLPEFGWRCDVVSADAGTLSDAPVDNRLAVPHQTGVVPVTVWSVHKMVERVVRPLGRRSGSPASEQRRSTGERRHRSYDEVQALLCSTPDQFVGWVIPAIRAGLQLVQENSPSAIYSTGPPHSSHLAAIAVQKWTRLPAVIDLRDPWARNPLDVEQRGRLRNRIHSRLERWCVQNADRVILNTDGALEDFKAVYGPKISEKFQVIPNGFDPDIANAIAQSATADRHGNNETIRLCHPGAVYGPRNLGPCIQAVEQLNAGGKQIILEQVGRVESERNLCPDRRPDELPKEIVLHGQLPHHQAMERMAAADILVVVQAGTSVQVPSKLFEMLAFRKPILALVEPGPTAQIVQKYRLGVVVDPSNRVGIVAEIHHAINDMVTRPPRGLWNAACRQFDGRRLTGQLADLLATLSS